MFLRGFVLSLIPLISYIYSIQSWVRDFLTNDSLQILYIAVLLLIFSLLYLRKNKTKISLTQAITFPFRIFLSSLLIFILLCSILGISLGMDALAMQAPHILTSSILFFAKALFPMLIVGIINYVIHSQNKKSDALDEHLM